MSTNGRRGPKQKEKKSVLGNVGAPFGARLVVTRGFRITRFRAPTDRSGLYQVGTAVAALGLEVVGRTAQIGVVRYSVSRTGRTKRSSYLRKPFTATHSQKRPPRKV